MVKNVLLVTVDSLRANLDTGHALSTDRPPGLADLNLGVPTEQFTKAFATGPGTTPSFPALLTGTLPLSYEGLGPLSEMRPRVSTNLRDAGLTTGAFQCNPFLSESFDYDVGFDEFRDYQNSLMGLATRLFPRGIEADGNAIGQLDQYLHVTDVLKWSYQTVMGKPRPYVGAEVITDDTLSWLDEIDSPFFCWTHYMDVHHPCHPPAEYRDRYGVEHVSQSEVSQLYSRLCNEPKTLDETEISELVALYYAAIDYTVAQIQRILAFLDAEGLLEETLVVMTSDHGELFGEHGQYSKPERMYDELLRVPLIIGNPPECVASATDDLVSLLDIPPMIHKALNLAIPEPYAGRLPGRDAARDYVMSEHEVNGDVVVGARSNRWLYEVDKLRDEQRLFECRNGGFERVSVNAYEPDDVDLRTVVHNRLSDLDVPSQDWEDSMDDDTRDRLEHLGYL